MNVLLLGPPGAGKGTQADLLAGRLGLRKLATGDVLRAARREGTEMGRLAQAAMDRGDLVPDEVILGILKDAMAEPASSAGVVLDGAVRTRAQAEGLERVLHELGQHLDVVLMFDVPDDELVRRLAGRTVCERCQTPYAELEPGAVCPRCGGRVVRRPDDEPEAIRHRLVVYREQTAPVLEWYRRNGARVVTIAAMGDIHEVTARVVRALEQ